MGLKVICERTGKRDVSKSGFASVVTVITAYLIVFALLKWPEKAKEAAQRALEQWYHGVAPVLFPFMMLMPLIASEDAARLYKAVFGKIMGILFGLPGEAAPAVVVGMVAGSPACAIAAGSTALAGGMSKAQLVRLVGCVGGMSPAFLISVVGKGILNNSNAGNKLLISQLSSQVIMLLATRNRKYRETAVVNATVIKECGHSGAVLSVLMVAGYMVFFSILTSVVSNVLGNKWGQYIICMMEVTAGADFVAGLAIAQRRKMMVMTAMFGFGGASICAQNMKILAKYGIQLREYIPWRITSAVVSAFVMLLQTGNYSAFPQITKLNWMEIASVTAIILVIPALFGLKKHIS